MRKRRRPRRVGDFGQTEPEFPTRAHGAAGRRQIWARRLSASEAQIAWWSKQDRFSSIVEQTFSGWKAVAEDGGVEIRRTFPAGSLGEAALFTVLAGYLHGSTDSPSQLQLHLDGSGSVEIRLQDEEDEQVTPDEGWMAYLLDHLIQARRRKRSRVRRALRRLAASLGRGPARLSEEELRAGLKDRGWVPVEKEGRCLGVQQGYLFVLPDLAQFFGVQAAALLGSTWEDLDFELGVSDRVAAVIVYTPRGFWPPAYLFDALEMVERLAKERHGAPEDLGVAAVTLE